MNAPYIWIVFPGLVGLVLWLLRYKRLAVLITGVLVCAGLAILAAILPIGETVRIGSLSFEIPSTLTVLGRQFILTNNERTFLTLIYGLGSAWFLGAGITWAHRFFIPFGLGMIASLVAALAVEPFLYAALLVQLAVLFSIPILSPPENPVRLGVQRYLLFQTLAMPFILIAGWMLGAGEGIQGGEGLLLRAGIMLGMGFAFWLAVFPFYAWVPQLTHETHPYPAGFVLSLLPMSMLMLGLDFLNGFGWLRSNPGLYQILQFVGILMVVTAGVWSAFQKDLARLLGYAVIFETGFALLAISLQSLPGMMMFASGLLPRLLGLIVLTLGLGVVANHEEDLTFENASGLIQRLPLAAIAITAALLSMGGFPTLAGFPVRLEILEQLGLKSSVVINWVLIGNLFFMIGAVRVLSRVVRLSNPSWVINESWPQRILLGAGILFLILFGLLPNEFYESILFVLRVAPEMFFSP